MSRPQPPPEIFEPEPIYVPSKELDAWAREVFLSEQSPLWNPEHDHLNSANIGWLWTNEEIVVNQQRKAGMAMLPRAQGNKIIRGIFEQQLVSWFGEVPDFLITLDGPLMSKASDRQFFRVGDHELWHCGQKYDKDGIPQFDSETGLPKFAMRGHDREYFDGEIVRWGALPVLGEAGVKAVRAALKKPQIPEEDIVGMCATCALK